MTVHKEGYVIILTILAVLLVLNVVAHFIWPDNKLVHNVGYAASVVFFLLIVQFFRSPDRTLVPNENLIMAPADGKVVVIEEVEEPEYFQGRRKQVSIFMSPLNAHVNWYPIGGEIQYVKYHPGRFLVAWHPKSSVDNERTTIVTEHKNGKELMYRQIAGAVARRICYYVHRTQKVKAGEEFGFIKFGSRVDIILPTGSDVCVKIGDKVKSRITKLGSIS